MSCLSWNCRGLGNPPTVQALNILIKYEDPSFAFLMETKLNKEEWGIVLQNLGFEGQLVVDCDARAGGRRGGLCLLWKEKYTVSILSSSLLHIDALVAEGDKEWRLTGIYGWHEEGNKILTWQLIGELAESYRGYGWLCVGDFNEIMYGFEKIGGRVKEDKKMAALHACIQDAQLVDLGYEGFSFTWTNGQTYLDNIQERLDRCFGSLEWIYLYPEHKVSHLPRIASDYRPLLVLWEKCVSARIRPNRKRRKIYCFESMWLLDETCKRAMRNAWQTDNRSTTSDNLATKIQRCGDGLKVWGREHFGNVNYEIRECEEILTKNPTSAPTTEQIRERRITEDILTGLYKNRNPCGINDPGPIGLKTGIKTLLFP